MGSSSKGTRTQKQYVGDHPNKEVHPLNCVPQFRSYGSWTHGVKAWKKGDGGSADSCVGWLHPPRLRNKGHKNRYNRQNQKRGLSLPQEEEE